MNIQERSDTNHYSQSIGGTAYQGVPDAVGSIRFSQHANSGSFSTPFRFNALWRKSFGEAFAEHNARSAELDHEPTNGSSRKPLKIKEKREQTGSYYYGARYYNPRWMCLSASGGWLSVDPLAHKYPNMSSYVFTGNNPVMLVDPDGRQIDHYFGKNGHYLGSDGVGNNIRIHNTIQTKEAFAKAKRQGFISLRHRLEQFF